MDEMAIYQLIYRFAIRRQKHLNQFQARTFWPLIIVDFGLRRDISRKIKLQVSRLKIWKCKRWTSRTTIIRSGRSASASCATTRGRRGRTRQSGDQQKRSDRRRVNTARSRPAAWSSASRPSRSTGSHTSLATSATETSATTGSWTRRAAATVSSTQNSSIHIKQPSTSDPRLWKIVAEVKSIRKHGWWCTTTGTRRSGRGLKTNPTWNNVWLKI